MDVSSVSLQRVNERMPRVQTALVSVLDDDGLTPYHDQFDVVVIAAVLHHLIGPTRKASARDAMHGLRNSFRLVRPGGTLVVLEPVFKPRVASSSLFWLKRGTTSVTDQRVPLLGYWNNIGAPVVAFYTAEQVKGMVEDAGGQIIASQAIPERVGWGARVMRKDNLTVIAAKPDEPTESG